MKKIFVISILFTIWLLFAIFVKAVFADVEFLIFARPSNIALGGYDYGDLVIAKNYGWTWGKEELNIEKFYRLRVTDMALSKTKSYLVRKADLMRKYQLPIDNLSTDIKNQMLSTGAYTFNKTQFNAYILEK
jgi:hypothetical protein